MSDNVWPSSRDPYHGDIVQGRLGNCFLIASLQALASCQPRILKSIISLSPLTCSFYRQGQRIDIPSTIEPITDQHQYCRSTTPDVHWPYIIEQAYAQFYGGRYENLAGGNTSEAFYDLLGQPIEELEPDDRGVWDKIEQGLAEQTALVTCGAVVTNDSEARTSNAANGLIVNHAYAVLATFIHQQTREKYVLIHNPQGINHILKENLRARTAFLATVAKSHPLWSNTRGTQLLPWSELRRTCNRIQICHLNVESRQLLSGDWTSMSCGGCSNFATFYRNPFILLPSAHLKRWTLVLGHTTDQRHERAEADVKLSYAQLGITLVQLKSHTIPTHDNYEVVSQSKFWNKREVTFSVDFEPKLGQQYAILLSTYYPDVIATFWLQIFSNQSLPSIELRTWTSGFQQAVQSVDGEWHRNNAGGRRNKSSPSLFYRNPAYALSVPEACSVRLIVHQPCKTVVPLAQCHPLGIYVLSTTTDEEAVFARARSISRLVPMNAGEEYYIVPTCYEANTLGRFILDVLCDVPFTLDSIERKPPTPPIIEEEKMTPTATAMGTKTKGSKDVPKKRVLSLAAARASTLSEEYFK